jgi:hypothetical protein
VSGCVSGSESAREETHMKSRDTKVKASVKTMAYYNMILTEAKDRIDKLKAETKLSFQMIQ